MVNQTSRDALVSARSELMRACAEASVAEMEAALQAFADLPAVEDIRPPQTGLVMLRGRMGGNGAAFNLGEATVTRAAVRLSGGEMGIAYLFGRDHLRARLAALCDALGQHALYRETLQRFLVEPVAARLRAEREVQCAETAATRVDFFTMVRGES